MPVRSLSGIEAIEATPLSTRALPENTYAALIATAERTPEANALSFFLTADAFERAHTWTYRELIADITRAANLFHNLGVTPTPNLRAGVHPRSRSAAMLSMGTFSPFLGTF